MNGGTSRFDRVAPWAIAAFALVALWPLRRHGLSLNDDGWYLQPVMRMLQGELLYRDVWTFYAPGIHHLLAWIFEVTGGPSLLTARTVWLALIATSAVLSHGFARRFVPAWLAFLPAATYVLAPGPWHKSYYATLAIAFFVLLARAFERPSAKRFAALGAWAGLALVTRQDLGLAELGIGLVAAPLPALFPEGFERHGPRSPRHATVWSAALLAAFTIPVALVAAWYSARGALPELVDATFVRAFAQAAAHPSALAALGALLSPRFAMAGEGRFVGALMLVPLALYPALAIVIALRVRRDGVTREHALLGALLGFAIATLTQMYRPLLLLRFLQSALPLYLLVTIAAAQAMTWLRTRGRTSAAHAVAAAAFGAAALLVEQVVFGLPAVVQPIYTGSARVLRLGQPVEVLGERFYEGFGLAEEIRLARAFFATHAAPGEPTLGLPTLTLYNTLLERPNPTRYLNDHPSGNFVMTAEQKSAEAARLLASPARFMLIDQNWYARTGVADPLLAAARAEFHPVRGFGSVLILERGNDPDWTSFAAQLRSALTRGPNAAGIEPLRRFAAEHPDEPLAWRLLGTVLQARGDAAGSISALERAAALDPADPTSLEAIAQIHIQRGRSSEARAAIARAREVRDSPTLQRVSAALDAAGGR
jgi:hypothetical protein